MKVDDIKPYEQYFASVENSKKEWVHMNLQDIISNINKIRTGEIIEIDNLLRSQIEILKKENQNLKDQYTALIKVSSLNNTK